MREDLLNGLTEEQVKKVKACKSSDEILALAKAEGVELSEEQLEAVSGGGCDSFEYPWMRDGFYICSKCDSNKTKVSEKNNKKGTAHITCQNCGYEWNIHQT